jgi:hypothetical protein
LETQNTNQEEKKLVCFHPWKVKISDLEILIFLMNISIICPLTPMASRFFLPVALTLENGFSLVATGSHMIEGAAIFNPQRPWHCIYLDL